MQKTEKQYKYIDTVKGDRTLLILHGMAGNKETMFDRTPKLRENFRCIYLDLPGHNYLSGNNIDSLKDIASYVIEFVHQMKLNDLGLLGYSFGGNVALKTYHMLNNPKKTPLCLWASPVFGKAKMSSLLLINLGSIIPYTLWNKEIFVKLIHFLGADFSKNDIDGMKSTDKKILRMGMRLINEKLDIPINSKVFLVMDPVDPFVQANSTNKYDMTIEKCGHSGDPNKMKLAVDEINKFFARSF